MFHETGCYGRVVLGELPLEVQERLTRLPGEWLEFDPGSNEIVVRLCQPSSAPCLPTISSELVRMLAEIPGCNQAEIPGGDLYVHTESKGQLVRLRVETGGALRISWAHPDYSRAQRKAYTGSAETSIDPRVQCLNGCVSLVAAAPSQAARELETLADTYEGLYPEGEFALSADEQNSRGQLQMRDLNLDVQLLLQALRKLAAAGTLSGRIGVSSFAANAPEQHVRFLLEQGEIWVQHPVLWEEPDAEVMNCEL